MAYSGEAPSSKYPSEKFESGPEVASDSLSWEHYTKARLEAVPFEPGIEVDETHQFDKPIGGTGGTK